MVFLPYSSLKVSSPQPLTAIHSQPSSSPQKQSNYTSNHLPLTPIPSTTHPQKPYHKPCHPHEHSASLSHSQNKYHIIKNPSQIDESPSRPLNPPAHEPFYRKNKM